MYNDRILKASQVVRTTGHLYVTIGVSMDAYLQIVTQQKVYHLSSKTRGEIIFAVTQRNHSRTILTHTDKCTLVLDGRSPCT